MLRARLWQGKSMMVALHITQSYYCTITGSVSGIIVMPKPEATTNQTLSDIARWIEM